VSARLVGLTVRKASISEGHYSHNVMVRVGLLYYNNESSKQSVLTRFKNFTVTDQSGPPSNWRSVLENDTVMGNAVIPR